MTPPNERQIIVPHNPDRSPMRAVRNLLIQSSLAELKALGHHERYLRAIAPHVLAELTESIGPGWLRAELAIAHYLACDELGLDPAQLDAIGRRVGERLSNTMMVSIAKTARQVGYTPWMGIGPFTRLADRLFDGGSKEVTKVGPKDLEIDVQGIPLFRSRYFSAGYVGVTRAAFDIMGARAVHVRLSPFRLATNGLQIHVSWV